MSPVQVFGESMELADANKTTEVRISRAQLRRELEELAKTAQAGGFRQLADSQAPGAAFAEAEFFARYFEFYFRQGHLLTFGIDQKAAEARLKKDLSRAMGTRLLYCQPSRARRSIHVVQSTLRIRRELSSLWPYLRLPRSARGVLLTVRRSLFGTGQDASWRDSCN